MPDEGKAGAVKAPPKIVLNWDFRFWDTSEDSALPRGFRLLGKGGFENATRVAMTVSVSDPGGDPSDTQAINARFRADQEIGSLTETRRDATVDLHLVAPATHDAVFPAGPHTESPREDAQWNRFFQIQFRSATFPDLGVDKHGFFVVDGDDVILPCRISDADRGRGVPPHAYLRIYAPKGSGSSRTQQLDVDVKFDVCRPLDARTVPKSGVSWTDTGDHGKLRKRGRWREHFDTPYLVIHCTGWVPEDRREAENERRAERDKEPLVMGATYFASQLAQLTTGASIHYLVDIDGHAVKVVEEDFGAWHAGWHDSAGWRAYRIGNQTDANRTSIGIEHVASPSIEWSERQKRGSVRLVRDVTTHFGILPCDVVRHRDLNFKKSSWTHTDGKPCPGRAVPWSRYQDEGLALWAKGTRPGEIPLLIPEEIYEGVFDLVEFIDDPLTGENDTEENRERQRAAIEAIQMDIQRIGHWCIKRRSTNLGVADEALKYCTEMIQEKFMIAHGEEPTRMGGIDFRTAEVIAMIVSHDEDVLPLLP